MKTPEQWIESIPNKELKEEFKETILPKLSERIKNHIFSSFIDFVHYTATNVKFDKKEGAVNYKFKLLGMLNEIKNKSWGEIFKNYKTFSKHFRDIKDPKIRKEALENYKAWPGFKAFSLKDALQRGFIWSNTPQESDYWRDIYNKIEKENA